MARGGSPGERGRPPTNCICSCQRVANKHQIYMHFERSPFTIGFLSGAVARERRRGERGPGEAGRLAAATWRGAHASGTATHAPGGLPPRSPAGPRAPPRCRFGQSSSSPLASSPGSPLLPPRVERLRCSHSGRPRRRRGGAAGARERGEGVPPSPPSCLSWRRRRPAGLPAVGAPRARPRSRGTRRAGGARLASARPGPGPASRRVAPAEAPSARPPRGRGCLHGVVSAVPDPGLPGEEQDRPPV